MSAKTKAKKKATIPAPKPVMQHLSVNYRLHTHVDREGTGEYDGDDVSHDMDGPFGLTREDGGSWDFIVPGELQPSYWVVWVRYSTGDSFSSSRGCVAWIDAYRTREDALHVIEALRAHNHEERNAKGNLTGNYKWICKVRLPSDKSTREISVTPWTGYFEGVESIELRECQVS